MSHKALRQPTNIRDMQTFPRHVMVPPAPVFAAGLRDTPTRTGVTGGSAAALTVSRGSGWADFQLPAHFSALIVSKPQGQQTFPTALHNRQRSSKRRLLLESGECDHQTRFHSLFLCFLYCSRWIFIKGNAGFRVKLFSLLQRLLQ